MRIGWILREDGSPTLVASDGKEIWERVGGLSSPEPFMSSGGAALWRSRLIILMCAYGAQKDWAEGGGHDPEYYCCIQCRINLITAAPYVNRLVVVKFTSCLVCGWRRCTLMKVLEHDLGTRKEWGREERAWDQWIGARVVNTVIYNCLLGATWAIGRCSVHGTNG